MGTVTLSACENAQTSTTPSTTTAGADDAVAAQIQSSARRRAAEARRVEARQAKADAREAAAEKLPPASATKAPATPGASGGAPSGSSTGGAILGPRAASSFAALEGELGGSSGVAVARAGAGGPVASVGRLRSGVAWSSIKTAIAAAVYARGAPSGQTTDLLRRAITASDNAAAEQLWAGLGAPPDAGAAVTQALRGAGDDTTVVQTERVRPGYTAFGQTEWPLTSQVRFAAGLACSDAGRHVLDLMSQVVPDQRWGLGSAGVPAAFKGGWGPGSGGGYLVRQLGILTIDERPVAVAIATLPADGAFATGTRNLSRIAGWVREHVRAGAAPRTLRC